MNQFINANPDACIGCRTCEVACVLSHGEEIKSLETAHFNARLKVIVAANVTVPVMCRQCDDAPCAAACPNGAIELKDEHVVVIQEKCIGCKTCVLACPFGAMQVKVRTIPRVVNGQHIGVRYKAEALKCDLCSSNPQGPACIRACPTDALTLVKPVELEKIQRERQLAAIQRDPRLGA
ncbi:hypothetical protein DKL61_11060 [Gammaproteobacteria bacterium ESL0073]|nr:hypothetical protein DKL61_11060 [Gammaproteobacteria bacterium ESL0073]